MWNAATHATDRKWQQQTRPDYPATSAAAPFFCYVYRTTLYQCYLYTHTHTGESNNIFLLLLERFSRPISYRSRHEFTRETHDLEMNFFFFFFKFKISHQRWMRFYPYSSLPSISLPGWDFSLILSSTKITTDYGKTQFDHHRCVSSFFLTYPKPDPMRFQTLTGGRQTVLK